MVGQNVIRKLNGEYDSVESLIERLKEQIDTHSEVFPTECSAVDQFRQLCDRGWVFESSQIITLRVPEQVTQPLPPGFVM